MIVKTSSFITAHSSSCNQIMHNFASKGGCLLENLFPCSSAYLEPWRKQLCWSLPLTSCLEVLSLCISRSHCISEITSFQHMYICAPGLMSYPDSARAAGNHTSGLQSWMPCTEPNFWPNTKVVSSKQPEDKILEITVHGNSVVVFSFIFFWRGQKLNMLLQSLAFSY